MPASTAPSCCSSTRSSSTRRAGSRTTSLASSMPERARLFDRLTIVGAAGGVGTLLARSLRDSVGELRGIDLAPPRERHWFDAFYSCDVRQPSTAADEALVA